MRYGAFPLSLWEEQGTQQITSTLEITSTLCSSLHICGSMGAMPSFQQNLQPKFHNELSEALRHCTERLNRILFKDQGRRRDLGCSAPLTCVPLFPSLLKAVVAITNKNESLVSPRKGAQFNIAPVNTYTFLWQLMFASVAKEFPLS